ncbi:MAG: MarR family transcriptional regulator [Oscillospiraceae bacterium]|nr:MarR family transcriptional regulator [Oscillospiraceae bacterium]
MADISGIDLMHQFHHTFNLMHRQYHQISNDKVGIRHGQGKILMILTREDGIGQKELAERLQIRAATLSELLDKMQKNGWIVRKNNENDRRKINIHITEEGKAVSEQNREARNEMAEKMFGVLSDAEKETLKKLFERLDESLQQNGSDR